MLMAEGDPGPAFFWDGRATSLEQQVLMPIADPNEMGFEHPAMINRLSNIQGYRQYFVEAFGANTITADHVASALAEFVRTRVSGNAPYDRWAYGAEGRAMSPPAQQGSDIFFFKGRCGVCHAGFNFSDGLFHNLGVGWNAETKSFADEGRLAVSHAPGDRGRFKTPGLRDVAKHAPYMHDGSLATLREVVEFYNRGGNRNPWLSQRIVPLGLTTEEVDAVVAFLEALNGEGYQDRAPRHFPQ
jgi:cytochrome c peroxidase